ncbi:hypothetical protein ACGFJT_41900 [Actinomadura geliboluensis]|uniref:hypothetical protein n=1 Tax=Actinomadura geliboluensis TaxID=882440 RepID=UPI0037217455
MPQRGGPGSDPTTEFGSGDGYAAGKLHSGISSEAGVSEVADQRRVVRADLMRVQRILLLALLRGRGLTWHGLRESWRARRTSGGFEPTLFAALYLVEERRKPRIALGALTKLRESALMQVRLC